MTSTGSHSEGSPADKATTQQIGHAFAVVFGSNYTPAQSVAELQNGTVFASTLEAQSKTSRAQAASAKVIAVRLMNPDVAAVTFSISVGGTVLVPSGHGYAVRENGTWKVAAESLCGLLGLEGTPPKPCKDKSVTALPH